MKLKKKKLSCYCFKKCFIVRSNPNLPIFFFHFRGPPGVINPKDSPLTGGDDQPTEANVIQGILFALARWKMSMQMRRKLFKAKDLSMERVE